MIVNSPFMLAALRPSSLASTRLASRFERLEKQGVLETTSSDLCCEGREDPAQHLLAWLFGLERGSYCDGFHKVQQLTTSVHSPHPLLADFSR